MLPIDCLQVPKPTRDRFEEWRLGGIDYVHITLSIWENARETMSNIGKWNRALSGNSDLVAQAETAQDIETIAASGRTAVIFGCQNSHYLKMISI